MSSKNNIVLVHGAWADGSSWSGVIPILQEAGYTVAGIQLPLTGLDQDIAATRRVLNKLAGSSLLVAHSYGGAVISGAAVGQSNVTGLVFVAAYAPDEGESLLDLNGRFDATEGVKYIEADAEGYAWLNAEAFPRVFAQDVDSVQAKVMAAIQKPNIGSAFGVKAGPPAWSNLPNWYIVSQNDLTINPDLERWMAERMKASVTEIPSSHASPVSHPREIAELILAAARDLEAR